MLLKLSHFCFYLFTFLIRLDHTVLEQECCSSWIVLYVHVWMGNKNEWNLVASNKLKFISFFLPKNWGWNGSRWVLYKRF